MLQKQNMQTCNRNGPRQGNRLTIETPLVVISRALAKKAVSRTRSFWKGKKWSSNFDNNIAWDRMKQGNFFASKLSKTFIWQIQFPVSSFFAGYKRNFFPSLKRQIRRRKKRKVPNPSRRSRDFAFTSKKFCYWLLEEAFLLCRSEKSLCHCLMDLLQKSELNYVVFSTYW